MTIRNGTLVTPAGRRPADIGIAAGEIAVIADAGELEAAAADVDARGLHVLPGVIDGHVHFREPGLEHEETWLTGTHAAVMGGVTTVLEMPNTLPPTDTVDRARAKAARAARSAYCDFGLFGLVGLDLDNVRAMAGSGLVIGLKVFLGPTTGDLRAPDDDGLRAALDIARQTGLRVAFHAEDRALVEAAPRPGFVLPDEATRWPTSRHARPTAEVIAIDHAARLLHETGAAGHVLHLSSADGLAAVAALACGRC